MLRRGASHNKTDRRTSYHGPAGLNPVLPGQKDVAKPEPGLQNVCPHFFFNAVETPQQCQHAGDDDNGVDPSQELGTPKANRGNTANHINADRRKEQTDQRGDNDFLMDLRPPAP